MMRLVFLASVWAALGLVWALVFKPLVLDPMAGPSGGASVFDQYPLAFYVFSVAAWGAAGALLYFWERRSGHHGMLGIMPLMRLTVWRGR